MASRISCKLASASKVRRTSPFNLVEADHPILQATTNTSRHHPYHKAPSRAARGSTSSSTSTFVTTPTRPAVSRRKASSVRPPNRTMRDVYMDNILARYPNFVPRHDFDVFALGDGRYQGPESKIRSWLDDELAMIGDTRLAIESARDMLSAPGIATGSKPTPGDAGVFIRQIPRSQYSIRLFPGSPSFRQYCLDFVETSTHRPVNSPFEFELWAIGSHTSPNVYGPVRLRSLESAFGYAQRDITPGEEKFVLTDGMTCLLTRPGHKPIRFTVPTRRGALESFDGDDLELPQHIA
ncbi:hypothetical protein C8T65DRAFT_579624 [Cerioporus squamosus]|nr:hypothetical protein C8T65DRAFT_579624 [Cerioporus squamosus]